MAAWINKRYNLLVEAYILAFLTLLLFSRMLPFVQLINGRVNTVIFALFALCGGLLVLWDLLHERIAFKTKGVWLLTAFLVVMAISSALNYRYGFAENIKTLVWTTIHFALYYSLYHRLGKEEFSRFLRRMFQLIILICLMASIVSIWQYMMNINYSILLNGGDRRQGYVEGRLFGIYNDPNFAAVTACYACFGALFCLRHPEDIPENSRRAIRVYYILSIVVQFIYISLSASRTGIGFGAFALGVLLGLGDYARRKKWGRSLVILAGAALIAFFGTSLAKTGFDSARALIYQAAGSEIKQEELLQHREDVGSFDGSARSKIWTSYLKDVVAKNPLIGVSPRNAEQYIQENMRGTFLAKTKYETHNGYLSVLVGTGAVGSAIILGFVVVAVVGVCKKLKNGAWADEKYRLLLAIVILLAGYSAFFTELFFVNTLTDILFWVGLGYLLDEHSGEDSLKAVQPQA